MEEEEQLPLDEHRLESGECGEAAVDDLCGCPDYLITAKKAVLCGCCGGRPRGSPTRT